MLKYVTIYTVQYTLLSLASILIPADFFVFQFKFRSLKGKVVLVENTASLWGTTVRDFTQMNELCEKYGDKLVRKKSMQFQFFKS